MGCPKGKAATYLAHTRGTVALTQGAAKVPPNTSIFPVMLAPLKPKGNPGWRGLRCFDLKGEEKFSPRNVLTLARWAPGALLEGENRRALKHRGGAVPSRYTTPVPWPGGPQVPWLKVELKGPPALDSVVPSYCPTCFLVRYTPSALHGGGSRGVLNYRYDTDSSCRKYALASRALWSRSGAGASTWSCSKGESSRSGTGSRGRRADRTATTSHQGADWDAKSGTWRCQSHKCWWWNTTTGWLGCGRTEACSLC